MSEGALFINGAYLFIEAVLLIDKHPDFELCDSEKEQRGEYDVCVTHNDDTCTGHHGDNHAGKLRWPKDKSHRIYCLGREDTAWVDLSDECFKKLMTVKK